MTNSTNILNQIRNRVTIKKNTSLKAVRHELTRRDFVEQQLELWEGLDSYPPEPEKVPSIADQYHNWRDKWGNLYVGPPTGEDKIESAWQEFVKGRGKKIPYEEQRTTFVRLKDDDIRRQPFVLSNYFHSNASKYFKIKGTNRQEDIVAIMKGDEPIPKGVNQQHIDDAYAIAEHFPQVWLSTQLAKGHISRWRQDMIRLCDAFPKMNEFTMLDLVGGTKLVQWYHTWDKPVAIAHEDIKHLKTLRNGKNNTTITLTYINHAQLETKISDLYRIHFHTDHNELVEYETRSISVILAEMLKTSWKGRKFKVVNPSIIKHDRIVPFVSVVGKLTDFDEFYMI